MDGAHAQFFEFMDDDSDNEEEGAEGDADFHAEMAAIAAEAAAANPAGVVDEAPAGQPPAVGNGEDPAAAVAGEISAGANAEDPPAANPDEGE